MPLAEAVLIVILLLVVALLAAGVCRVLPLPYTVVLVVVGMAIGVASRALPALAPLSAFTIHPDLVLFVFLPALIFESGLNMDARRLARDLVPVLILAIPALLVSMALVGLGLWSVLGMAPLLALLFGALISATDPVAVIALFKELGAPARLTTLLEGESLLNDATAIVAFTIVLGMITGGATLDATSVLGAVARFVAVFFGGLFVGALLGLLLGELLRHLRVGVSSVLVMSVVMAYLSFVVAEHLLHVSGVMATLGAALAFGSFGVTRIPAPDTPALHDLWELIVHVCNSLLFLLVGLSIDPAGIGRQGAAILAAVSLVLLARAATVYTLVPAATRLNALPRVSLAERHIMWWGGLKGGLAIAMALAIPPTVAGADLVRDLTVGVVMFMLLVNAPTIRPLMTALKLDRMSAEDRSELAEGMHGALASGRQWLSRLRESGAISAMQARRANANLDRLLEVEAPQLGAGQLARHLKLDALRAEMAMLESLHAIGLVSQYTFLDMRGLIARDRERGVRESAALASGDQAADPFQRFEILMLRWLRERSWAARLLARYQALRLSQSLRRTIAGLLTIETALAAVAARSDLATEVRERVAQPYRERLVRRRERLDALRRDFHEVYDTVGGALASRVGIIAGTLEVEHARHSGRLGAKAYGALHASLQAALRAQAELPGAMAVPDARKLVARVPLLSGLSAAALEAVTRHAVTVSFLPGDVVIGEGEHGDALYIVARGQLRVHHEAADGRSRKVGELREGQFFGETALLGDHVRTATVIADTPCTLVRLTREDVMRLADKNEDLRRCLDEARAARLAETQSRLAREGGPGVPRA